MKITRTVFCAVTFGAFLAYSSSAQMHAQVPHLPAEALPLSEPIDTVELDQLLKTQPPEARFHTDDTISVSVFGMGPFGGGQLRVEDDGTVRLPFIGKVQVAGLTISELERSLASKLKDAGIVQDPQVTVVAVTQPWNIVTISGNVQKPGVFPAWGRLTLIDFITMAGGLETNLLGANFPTNSESSTIVTLIRPSLGRLVHIPLGSNPLTSPYARIPLMAGDVVRVGRAGVVYAVGAFKSQGSFPLKATSPTTAVQLMAMAGGIGYEGIRKEAHIIRTSGKEQVVLDLNIDDILKGKVADVTLEPNDVLFVPTSKMKAAIKGGGTGALVSFTNGLLLTTTR